MTVSLFSAPRNLQYIPIKIVELDMLALQTHLEIDRQLYYH